MSRATNDTADRLHALTFEVLIEQIEAQRRSGEPVSPQLLSQALKALKDNGVTAPLGAARVDGLKDTLFAASQAMDEDEGYAGRH